MKSWCVMATLLALLGCGSNNDSSRGREIAAGPSVRLIDSVPLSETDSAPLGGFTSFIGRDGLGQLYVSDVSNHQVRVFGASGEFLRSLGREGEGPGEFRLPAAIIPVPSREAMAIMDLNRSRLVLFSVHDGDFLSEVEVPFRHVGPNGASDGELFTLAPGMSLDPLARWRLDSDSVDVFGEPLESSVEGWQTVSASAGIPSVAKVDSVLIVWYPALGLRAYREDGSFVGNISLPAMRRRGEGDSLVQVQRDLRRDRSDSVAISTVLGMSHSPDGRLILVSQDADRISQNGRNARETAIRVFVTIVDASLTQACVDGQVPYETEVASLPIFEGNTITLLSRTVTVGGLVRNVLYSYEVDSSSCEWVPIPAWR